MIKHTAIVQLIFVASGGSAPNIGAPGDRGCVSCGTVYHGEWYVSGPGDVTLLIDARGRYWCLSCACEALANVGRRVDERTDYDYPWKFSDTGGLAGQHARVQKIEGVKQCPKCGEESGDDWRQCKGSCPMPMSPHYDESCARTFEDTCTVGAGVPSKSYTREVAAKVAHDQRSTLIPVHILSQEDQPYGSARRCCNHCGVMIWGAEVPLFVRNWTDWDANPNNCREVNKNNVKK